MSSHSEVTDMSKLLINEHPLQVLPGLATAIGLNEAILLQQIHYWLQTSKHDIDDRKWIYNSISKWQEQFPFWSESTIRRTINSLRKQELLLVTDEYNKLPIDKTLWYTIDYAAFERLTNPSVQNDHSSSQNDHTMWSKWPYHVVNMTKPLPETTTETNSESVVDVNVFQEYEKRWGIAPNATILSLQKYLQLNFDPQLIVAVMDLAQKKSKRWNYAAGILDNLEHEHNITTLDAYQKLNKRPTTRKQAAPVADRANF